MTRSLLCVTVTATSMAELRARRDAVSDADLVELRLDGVGDIDVAGALEGRRLPVIVTCRPRWQGGRFDGSEETRLEVLSRAWQLGAEWVDVELGTGDALIAATGGRRLIRSYHDFEGMPHDLETRVAALRASGTERAKLAVTASSLSDVVRLRDVARGATGSLVLIAMGETGVASRLLAAHLGSPWTYAGDGAAPGQLSLTRMRDEFGIRTVTPSTAVYGVLGRPIAHSLSPAMHNAAFRTCGIDAVYVPLEATSFDDFTRFADAFSVRGVSVTAPFKVDAYRASQADARAHAVGAVNTLARRQDRWESRNTDVDGFLAPLSGTHLEGRRVAVLGAGGAARGVALALTAARAAVTIHARNLAAGRALAGATGTTSGGWPPGDTWDVLVNTTPVGTGDGESAPVTFQARLDGRIVYDLVYNPPDTALLRQARGLGAHTIGGLPMLIAQAAAQWAWWTGRDAPTDVMRRAAHQRLDALHADKERKTA